MTDHEFILYLKVIHDKCTDRYYCPGCPYYTKFGCAFKHIPSEWTLELLEERFKEGRTKK